jgi:hypothetical protein
VFHTATFYDNNFVQSKSGSLYFFPLHHPATATRCGLFLLRRLLIAQFDVRKTSPSTAFIGRIPYPYLQRFGLSFTPTIPAEVIALEPKNCLEPVDMALL